MKLYGEEFSGVALYGQVIHQNPIVEENIESVDQVETYLILEKDPGVFPLKCQPEEEDHMRD